MIFGGCTRDAFPNLLKPSLVVCVGNNAQDSRGQIRGAIAARPPLHQDEFNVVLDDGIRLIWLAQKAGAVTGRFKLGVRDFVPDDGGKIIEADCSAVFLNGCVQGNDRVAASILATRKTHVTNDTDEASSGYECIETSLPYSVDLGKKPLVICHVTQLGR